MAEELHDIYIMDAHLQSNTLCSPSSLKWRTEQVGSLQRRRCLGTKKEKKKRKSHKQRHKGDWDVYENLNNAYRVKKDIKKQRQRDNKDQLTWFD